LVSNDSGNAADQAECLARLGVPLDVQARVAGAAEIATESVGRPG